MSESNVVTIGGEPIPQPGKPSKTAITAAKALLEAVEAGEVVGFAAIRLHADRSTSWETAGHVGGYGMVGAASIVWDKLKCTSQGE